MGRVAFYQPAHSPEPIGSPCAIGHDVDARNRFALTPG
jgi:hypothetical protein